MGKMLQIAGLLATVAAESVSHTVGSGSNCSFANTEHTTLSTDSITTTNDGGGSGSTTLLKLGTTLTFAALDLESHLAPSATNLPSVPEPGTELRGELEEDLADGLFDIMDGRTFRSRMVATPSFREVTEVAVVCVEEGIMDGHATAPVVYAFVELELDVEFQIEPSCLDTDELWQSDSCAQSAREIADAMDSAAMALRSSLYESELQVRFSESGDDGFTTAEPRADDFELLLGEGQKTISSRQLRMRAK